MNNKKVNVIIPFSGFYETIHYEPIEDEMYILIENNHKEDDITLDFHGYMLEYADAYTDLFNTTLYDDYAINLNLAFKELYSPKEYNFYNDTIYVECDYNAIRKLYNSIDKRLFGDYVRARFTSYSGFISFYPANLEDWGKFNTWDEVQLGTILEYLYDDYQLCVSDAHNIASSYVSVK